MNASKGSGMRVSTVPIL